MRGRFSNLRLLFLGVLAPCGAAQELLWERVGVVDKSRFGFAVEVIGDVNGDGWVDLMHTVGANVGTTSCINENRQLWILSGKDGTTLRIRQYIAPKRPYWTFAAAGDVDGDGQPDHATMIWDESSQANPSIIEVRRAIDDQLIWQTSGSTWSSAFGFALMGDLDLDGDGRPDLVATAPRGSLHGEIRAFSSKGRLLYRVQGTAQLEIGIWQSSGTLGKVGDVDGDGADDFVVGGIQPPTGAAVLISGKTGKILHVGVDPRPGDVIGNVVAGVGDIDGDGVPDFAAGTSKNFGEIVAVFSGKTGQAIRVWRGAYPFSNWGFSVAGDGVDVDRDGVPDVIAGAPNTGVVNPHPTGAVRVMSGRDGEVISTLHPTSGSGTALGIFVAMIPPQPGSPFGMYAVSELDYGSLLFRCLPSLGRLAVYRGSPPGVSTFGTACRGALPKAPNAGVRDLGGTGAKFTVFDAAPSAPAVLLVGLSRTRWGSISLPLPLAPWGYTGCSLFTSVDAALWTRSGSTGFVSLDVPLPLSKTGPLTLYGQWVSAGTGPLAPGGVSDAFVWRTK